MANPHREPKPLGRVIIELLEYDTQAFLCDPHDIPSLSDYLVGLLDVAAELERVTGLVRRRFQAELDKANDPLT